MQIDLNWWGLVKDWGYGEDNCGREVNINTDNPNVTGVYEVAVGNKTYLTIKFIETDND